MAARPQGSLLSVRENVRANAGGAGLGAEAGWGQTGLALTRRQGNPSRLSLIGPSSIRPPIRKPIRPRFVHVPRLIKNFSKCDTVRPLQSPFDQVLADFVRESQ